ncbi:MAG: hypothetical protein V7782_10115 [Psychromonas sp.]
MTLRLIFTSAIISSALLLSACSNNQAAIDAPNATSEVTMDMKAVPSDSEAKPAFSANVLLVMTSTVIEIDHEKRVVTLKDEDGKAITFTADEEVRNLDQVNVGDVVTGEYMQKFTVQVLEANNAEAAAGEIAAMGRSEEGEMPGMAIIDTTVEVLTVEDVNVVAKTFKLKNVNGVVKEFTAQNAANLTKVAVGDVVVMTYTEGFAISVDQKAAE